MKFTLFYLKLQLKKSIKVLPVFFFSIFLIIMFSVIGILFAGHVTKNANSFDKVKVAFVIPDDSKTSRQVLSFLYAMENVSAVSEFTYMPEEEAKESLAKGKVDVVVLVSPNFYHDVNTGVNSPVTVWMPKQKNMERSVFSELLSDGVRYVRVTQAAIYGLTDAMLEYETECSISDMEDLFTEVYVRKVLTRDDTFTEKILSTVGEQDLVQYYITVGVLLFMLMFGMCFGFLYQKEEVPVIRLLRRQGVSTALISVLKTIAMAMQLILFVVICFLAVKLYSTITGRPFLYMDDVFLLRAIVVSFSAAAFFHMMYALFLESQKGSLAIFMLNVFMLLLSGVLLPLNGAAEWMVTIRRYVPFAIWQQFISGTGNDTVLWVAVLLLTGIFEMTGVYALCKKS